MKCYFRFMFFSCCDFHRHLSFSGALDKLKLRKLQIREVYKNFKKAANTFTTKSLLSLPFASRLKRIYSISVKIKSKSHFDMVRLHFTVKHSQPPLTTNLKDKCYIFFVNLIMLLKKHFFPDGGVGERDAGHGARGRSSSKSKIISYIYSRSFHG